MTKPPDRGPEPISEILSRLFTSRGWGRQQDRMRLERAWADAAGPKIAQHTRVVKINRGVLEIIVSSSVLLQELTQFHKRRLLQALKASLTGVTLTDLRFKAGVIDPPANRGSDS